MSLFSVNNDNPTDCISPDPLVTKNVWFISLFSSLFTFSKVNLSVICPKTSTISVDDAPLSIFTIVGCIKCSHLFAFITIFSMTEYVAPVSTKYSSSVSFVDIFTFGGP